MDIDDCKLLFHSVQPTLQETSALNVSLIFWRHEISTHRSNIAFKLPELFLDINHDIVISKVTPLFLPSSIKTLIKKYIKSSGREIRTWAGYHDYHVSVYNFATDGNFLEYFDQLVWRPNGTICYGQTAQKLLNYQKLDDLHKFKLACLYCFEDQIMKLWPLVSDKYQIDDVNFNTKPFIHYWLHILLNQHQNFPRLHFSSVAQRMSYQCGVDNWPAMNYFWDQLDQNCQIEKILHIFDMICEKCIDYLVPKLTQPKWDKFMALIGKKLMNVLIDMRSSHQYIFLVWIRISKDFNKEEFLSLIERIWHYKNDHNDEDCIFCTIWLNSPDSVKEIALITIFSVRGLYVYKNRPLRGFPRNVACLINVLASATPMKRISLWNKNWYNLIKGTRPKYLNQMLELCLENKYDVVEFKNLKLADPGNVKVLEYSIELVKQRCYDELNQFLDFCYSSNHQQQPKRQFKQKILQFCLNWVYDVFGYEHVSELDILDKFIKDSFQDIQLEKQYKDSLVLHIVARGDFSSFLVNCEFQLIRNFSTIFVSSQDMMITVKNHILKRCRQCLNEGEIIKKSSSPSSGEKFLVWSTPGLEDFLKWCSFGECYVVL